MIKIICLGKIKEDYLNKLCDDYQKRIGKYHKIELIELKDNINQDKETQELLSTIKKTDYNILLDIEGKSYSSVEFANHIDKLFLSNGCVTFIIGSSVGVANQIKNMVNERI